jgi:hypothetical protein
MFMGEPLPPRLISEADGQAVLNFRFELRRDQTHTHNLSSSAALVSSDHNEQGDIAIHVGLTRQENPGTS